MNYLIDTNILLRLVEIQNPHHVEAKNAIDKLLKRGDTLHILLQNISEFWNVCTRPLNKNVLGFSASKAETELSNIEFIFNFLPDTEDVYKNWRKIVVGFSVSGVQVHDAKIVAAMKVYNIQNLLTFNTKDFKRYTDIKVIEPKDV